MLTKTSKENQYDIYLITDDKINDIEGTIRKINQDTN
jgi:vacuolar-type H+-ATPase subunit F/Vma7